MRRVLVVFVAMALPAVAAEDKLTPLVKQAEKLYQSGKYRESAAVLLKGYAIEPNPRLLYNIARSYDQAGDLREAVDYYQRYVGSSEGTDPQLLKRSALALERLRALIAKEDESRRRDEAEHQRLEAESKAAAERADAEAAAARQARSEADARNREAAEAVAVTRRRQRMGAIASGVVGVGGVVVGSVFGVQANAAFGRFHAAQIAADKDSAEAATRGDALIADVGFGVGVAALAAAVLLYPKGEEPKVAIVPVGAGAALVGRF